MNYILGRKILFREGPEAAAARMDELVGKYNDLVKEATKKIQKRDELLMYTVQVVQFHLLPHQVWGPL